MAVATSLSTAIRLSRLSVLYFRDVKSLKRILIGYISFWSQCTQKRPDPIPCSLGKGLATPD